MFNFRKSIITVLIATWGLIGSGLPMKSAYAGLFLSPMYLKMESQQGQSNGVLQVGNTSSKPIRVRLSATAFTYDENGVFQRYSPEEEKEEEEEIANSNLSLAHDLTPYLRYSPREMVIPANSTRRVRLISLLLPSLPEGEYRTAIFAETLQETTNAQGYKVGLNMSIGSALYVTKGEVKPEITVDGTSFDAKNKKIKLLINNTGTATAKGGITWTLKQGKNIIYSGESGGSFLPNSQTNIVLNRHENNQKTLDTGIYQLEGKIVWNEADKKQVSKFNFALEI